jgi:hypothetical protein
MYSIGGSYISAHRRSAIQIDDLYACGRGYVDMQIPAPSGRIRSRISCAYYQ